MYSWFSLLCIWNEHNIVNQLYSNKIKNKEMGSRATKNANNDEKQVQNVTGYVLDLDSIFSREMGIKGILQGMIRNRL